MSTSPTTAGLEHPQTARTNPSIPKYLHSIIFSAFFDKITGAAASQGACPHPQYCHRVAGGFSLKII
jgi:hypothetical protein